MGSQGLAVGAAGAMALVVVAGLWALAGPGSAPEPWSAPGSDAVVAEGRIAGPVGEARAEPQRCALNTQGVVGWTLRDVTPGVPFILLATGPDAAAQDFDILFYEDIGNCAGPSVPSGEQPAGAFGDDAGVVPDDAREAIVYLFAGAAGTFRYQEFAPLEPPDTVLDLVDTMHFQEVQVGGALSTYFDMYEPHLAIGGTGTLYATGHTATVDTHRSPAFFSTDDGATWARLPDPEPLPPATTGVPLLGGRIGQGNEGGIAADEAGRAWLYDAAWIAGASNLHGWCDDGARSCAFEPDVMDREALLLQPCDPVVRTLDRPWARAAGGRVLLANMGLRSGLVDETRAVAMVGLYDPGSGAAAWNTCLGVGGMAGVPGLRASDGLLAVPQVLRSPEGEGWLHVHHGTDPLAMQLSPPIVRVPKSWQLCQHFSSYSDFSAAGTYFLFAGAGPRTAAVGVSTDLEDFATLRFDAGGLLRYMWLEGSKLGDGALLTWGVAEDCDVYTPVTFYAAHVVVEQGQPVVRDASVVVEGVPGTCGHYMGNDLGPDGRAYLVVHASPGACLGPFPEFLPLTHVPWKLYTQDAGPTL